MIPFYSTSKIKERLRGELMNEVSFEADKQSKVSIELYGLRDLNYHEEPVVITALFLPYGSDDDEYGLQYPPDDLQLKYLKKIQQLFGLKDFEIIDQ